MRSPDYSISTPENVDLHLELAGLGNRICACLVDTVITYLLLLIVGLAIWLSILLVSSADIAISQESKNFAICIIVMFGILGAFIILFGYYIFFEARWQGQTPGKKLVEIRVIEQNGQPASWSSIFIRNIIRAADIGFFLIGLLCMLIDKNERRFGDLAAGTLVIRERTAALSKMQVSLQYEVNKNDALDIGRVTPEEYDLLVNFLKRRSQLARSQRPLVAHKLAEHFQEKLHERIEAGADEVLLERIYCAYQGRADNSDNAPHRP